MEEIIQAFGIDWRLIGIQMFNFALLVVALWYFLYTPVLRILEERQEKLRQGVVDAEKAKIALTEAGKEKGVILQGARHEAESIVALAKAHAETKRTDIIHEAETKAARVIHDAQLRAEEEMERARKASEAEVAQAAILAAENILTSKYS